MGLVWRESRKCLSFENTLGGEIVLLGMLLGLLVCTAGLAAGLFGGYLQSLVGPDTEAMCVAGVLRFGAGGSGAVRYLPRLASSLVVGKPLLIFLGGCLFSIWRAVLASAGPGRAVQRPIFWAIFFLALLSFSDVVLEFLYVVIPKTKSAAVAGCCFLGDEAALSGGGAWRASSAYRALCAVGFMVLSGGIAAGVLAPTRLGREPKRRVGSEAMLLAAATLSLPWGYFFVSDVLAPLVLKTPFHRCVFDLAHGAPEGLLVLAGVFLGASGVAWWLLPRWLVLSGPDRSPSFYEFSESLRFISGIAYLCAVALASSELIAS